MTKQSKYQGAKEQSATAHLVSGVTADNYLEKVKTFYAAGAPGSMICTRDYQDEHGVTHPARVRQWGAWRAYFRKIGRGVRFMDLQAKLGKPWSVVAEWPHLFDAAATVQGDFAVGETFSHNYRPENIVMADAARRAIQVAAYRARRVVIDDRGVTDRRIFQDPIRIDTPTDPYAWVKSAGYWTDPAFDRDVYEATKAAERAKGGALPKASPAKRTIFSGPVEGAVKAAGLGASPVPRERASEAPPDEAESMPF